MTARALMVWWAVAGPAVAVPEPPRPPATFTLEWNGPPDCGSAAAIEARVQALLSGPPMGEGIAEVIATVRRGPSQVELELTTRFEGAEDVRTMTAPSCADVVEATAVLLSVALEPGLSDRSGGGVHSPPEAEPAEDPGETRPPLDVPVPRVALPAGPSGADTGPSQAPRGVGSQSPNRSGGERGRGLRLSWGVAAGVEYGGLRAATGAVRMALGLRRRSWTAEALGTYLTPRQLASSGVGGRYQLGTAGLRGCWVRGAAGLGSEVCGGAEAGRLRVDSRGVSPAVSTTGPFAGPAASLAGIWSWSRFAVTLRAEGVARVWGSRTRLAGEVLVEQFPVSLRMLAGVRLTFASFSS